MEKYDLDNVLENYYVPGPGTPIVESSAPPHKKKVRFSDQVDVQWPADAARLRLKASLLIAKRKQERETKLLSLVYQSEARHRPRRPDYTVQQQFPFPLDFKPIDFDHLDPYKLYEAAEYLRQEQRKLEEPFFLHSKKIKSLEKVADLFNEKELNRINAIQDSASSTSNNKFKPPAGFFSSDSPIPYPYSVTIENREGRNLPPNSLAAGSSRSSVLFAQMNNPGGKVKKEPGYYPKPTVTKVPPQPRVECDALAMKNVAVWIKSNFLIKPVPLLLRSPRQGPGPQPSMISNLPVEPSGFSIDPPPPLITEPRELHILNGLVMGRNSFNDIVGNSFAENYDTSGFKDNDDYTQNWIPYRFRCTIHMTDFRDNEISIYFRRPFLNVKGECPRTARKIGQKGEETIEIPDWVPVENLKFFRLKDGRIIVEETGRRAPKPTSAKPDPEVLAVLKRYFPHRF